MSPKTSSDPMYVELARVKVAFADFQIALAESLPRWLFWVVAPLKMRAMTNHIKAAKSLAEWEWEKQTYERS